MTKSQVYKNWYLRNKIFNTFSKPILSNISCACGCGEYPIKGRKFKRGHNNHIRKFSDETKLKMSLARSGEKHPNYGKKLKPETVLKIIQSNKGRIPWNKGKTGIYSEATIIKKSGENHPLWKGDKAGYAAIHVWINNHLPKPDLCEICGNEPPYDAACVTGIYNRDFSNWKYLCRHCHMIFDYDRGMRRRYSIRSLLDMKKGIYHENNKLFLNHSEH